MRHGELIRIFGDGASARDYSYVSDITDVLLAALDRPQPFGNEIFNLGNAHPIRLTNLVHLIEDSLGSPAVIEHQPEQPGDVQITYANIDKARRLLGYHPKVAIGEGIERFCSWYLREPDLKAGARELYCQWQSNISKAHDANQRLPLFDPPM